jgi:nucleotide-binding universal stress UspA family protein
MNSEFRVQNLCKEENMGYRKILVTMDRSPGSEAIFEQALELAQKDGASLILFHCLPFEAEATGSYSDFYGQNMVNFSQAIQERLEKEVEDVGEWLDSRRQKAESQGVKAETEWRLGEAGSWIRELSRTWEVDLIIVGRRGRKGLAEMVLGSVSNHVVHNAPCSVLVVQGEEKEETEASKS